MSYILVLLMIARYKQSWRLWSRLSPWTKRFMPTKHQSRTCVALRSHHRSVPDCICQPTSKCKYTAYTWLRFDSSYGVVQEKEFTEQRDAFGTARGWTDPKSRFTWVGRVIVICRAGPKASTLSFLIRFKRLRRYKISTFNFQYKWAFLLENSFHAEQSERIGWPRDYRGSAIFTHARSILGLEWREQTCNLT